MRHLSDKSILNILRCPVCGEAFEIRDGKTLACLGARSHCYDLSSDGYVNLASPKQSGGGDSKEAVRARGSFLDKGYYKPIADALADTCAVHKDGGVLLDAGCGEGYYASFLNDRGYSTLGVDISKFAVQAASKRLIRDGKQSFFFAVGSVFELPVADNSVDVVTNVFAPCAEAEYARVLKNNGILVIAWAGERHLWGLKNAIYETTRENDGRADMPEGMTLLDTVRVHYTANVEGNDQIRSLFAMTPYYWRTSQKDAEKLSDIKTLETEIDVMISVYGREDGR